ncbi:hypothetical protein QSV08_02620 [Maribacter sp. BPC-D8]|uniref:hypothetical protein n=1 Tax=Maribacter sp. BPC-D8 TaxID=3053613 RepID=UPI002B46298B|nr:hypothetical protein [Maribacter sp. BPC-D8]WRI30137.1 hypothetical protein QSV08_02620 [Maribacter sp. BPC-D8]
MRNTLFYILMIIGMNSTLSAQDINLDESELQSILCQQWEIEYALMGGMKIGQLPGAADFDFDFHSDGKYDIISENEDNKSGRWIYDIENKYVELSIEEKTTSRIKFIDTNKLILILVSGQNDPPGLPSMEVHFKPM